MSPWPSFPPSSRYTPGVLEHRPGTFLVDHPCGAARAGRFVTRSGVHPTPMFMPVGTSATVRGVMPHELDTMGAGLVLANTYHLWIRPGLEVVAAHGGVGQFMQWHKGVLTDSGGFQAFSLGRLVKYQEWGVRFHSHVDGRLLHLSPEMVYDINRVLDPDCVMPLDVCLAAPAGREDSAAAVDRTLRWLERSRRGLLNPHQVRFGISQGGVFGDLRRLSTRHTVALGVDALAIGGLSVGESKEATWEALAQSIDESPPHLVRYLMGMGTPEDLVRAVGLGADIFDCVLPTRLGRHGVAYTREGKLNLRNASFRLDKRPIEEGCPCPACGQFTRAYVRHLLQEKEMLGSELVSLHNLWHYMELMRQMRAAIAEGRWVAFHNAFLDNARHVENR